MLYSFEGSRSTRPVNFSRILSTKSRFSGGWVDVWLVAITCELNTYDKSNSLQPIKVYKWLETHNSLKIAADANKLKIS